MSRAAHIPRLARLSHWALPAAAAVALGIALRFTGPETNPPVAVSPPPPRAPVGPPALPSAASPQAPAPAAPPPSAAPAGSASTDTVVASLPARPVPDAAPPPDTLFLTIVGEQVHYHWGRAGDRPPRIDGAGGAVTFAATRASPGAAPVATAVTDAATIPAAAPLDLGPAPQNCPRTLPAGSSQATADDLLRTSGCRYLSSCAADTQECSWYYQGRS